MITQPELTAEALGSFLASDMKDRFGTSHARLAELIPFAATEVPRPQFYDARGRRLPETADAKDVAYSDYVIRIPAPEGRVTPHTEAFQAVIWHLLCSHPLLQKRPTKWL